MDILPVVAQQKPKRSSRKRRTTDAGPRAVRSARREVRAEQQASTLRERQTTARAIRSPGGHGERPPSPFGGLPISEIAIFAGLVGVIIGVIEGNGAAMLVGGAVCGLGVIEVTAREHFSGFRSHATILAAIPAVALEAFLVIAFGQPRRHALVLVPVIPVFGLGFWLLRRRFATARQRRVVRAR